MSISIHNKSVNHDKATQMLIEQFKDTTGVIIAVNLRTDNTMAKRKKSKQHSTNHYTEN
jgi:hypothetical protein